MSAPTPLLIEAFSEINNLKRVEDCFRNAFANKDSSHLKEFNEGLFRLKMSMNSIVNINFNDNEMISNANTVEFVVIIKNIKELLSTRYYLLEGLFSEGNSNLALLEFYKNGMIQQIIHALLFLEDSQYVQVNNALKNLSLSRFFGSEHGKPVMALDRVGHIKYFAQTLLNLKKLEEISNKVASSNNASTIEEWKYAKLNCIAAIIEALYELLIMPPTLQPPNIVNIVKATNEVVKAKVGQDLLMLRKNINCDFAITQYDDKMIQDMIVVISEKFGVENAKAALTTANTSLADKMMALDLKFNALSEEGGSILPSHPMLLSTHTTSEPKTSGKSDPQKSKKPPV